MNNFLKSILGINLPSTDEVVQQAKAQATADRAQAQAQQQEDGGINPLSMIQFVLLSNGTMNLRMQWLDESVQAGTVFGEFLYRIHTGRFENSCLQMLAEMQQKDIKNKPFVEAAYKKWQELSDNDNDRPVVHPLHVFGVTRGPSND